MIINVYDYRSGYLVCGNWQEAMPAVGDLMHLDISHLYPNVTEHDPLALAGEVMDIRNVSENVVGVFIQPPGARPLPDSKNGELHIPEGAYTPSALFEMVKQKVDYIIDTDGQVEGIHRYVDYILGLMTVIHQATKKMEDRVGIQPGFDEYECMFEQPEWLRAQGLDAKDGF